MEMVSPAAMREQPVSAKRLEPQSAAPPLKQGARSSRPTGKGRAQVGLMWALLAVIAGLLGSCLQSTDATLGDPPSLSGIWKGPIHETKTGNDGNLILTVTDSGGARTGTWVASFTSGTTNGGAMSGGIDRNHNSFTINMAAQICPLSASAFITGTHAAGTYASTSPCPTPQSGTFSIDRQ